MQNNFVAENSFTKEPDLISPWIDRLLVIDNIDNIIKEDNAAKSASNVISLNSAKLNQGIFSVNSENDEDLEEEGARIYTYPVKKILTADNNNNIDNKILNSFVFEKNLEKENTYLSFNIDNSYFSFPVENILEIIRYIKPFKLYTNKIELLGLINHRGIAIPIYDFFAVNSHDSYTYDSYNRLALFNGNRFKYIVICSYNEENFGLCINNAGTIKKIKNKELITPNIIKYKNSKNLIYKLYENEEGKFSSIIAMRNLYDYLKL
ncbi:MAG: chemotaxis protein CheW [bacterium]